MSDYSAQGSITIKRLRNGDSLYIAIDYNGKALYQGVDPNSGAIAPDWTVAANQPVLTPMVRSSRGAVVTRSNHQWQYNGQTLLFTGATSSDGNWRTDATGKFQMNISSGDVGGALRIIGNLANPAAVANGQLEYSCTATLDGANYTISKSVDVIIQHKGATAFYGAVMASPHIIDATTPTSTLTTTLQSGADVITNYYVKWYKATTAWTAKNGQKNITVGRGDVDGTQLFIAEFYLSSTDTTPVARAGVSVIDSLDEFKVQFKITSAAKDVAPGQDVTVKGEVINMRTNSVQALTGAVWQCDVMEKDTWTSVKTSNTNTITVTTAETDRNNKLNDVEVVGQVEFN